MTVSFPILLVLSPDTPLPSLSQPVTPAFLSYQINPAGQLLCAGASVLPEGSVLMLGGTAPSSGEATDWLCRQIAAECQRQKAAGVVANWAEDAAGAGLASRLEPILRSLDIDFWVPESFASSAPNAQVLISSQLSGGTLENRLRQAQLKYGDRIALAIECTPWDFTLPCPHGQGTALTLPAMRERFARHHCRAWFSEGFCCSYFTYGQEEALHLVLYDTAASVQAKLSLAEALELSGVILAWEEIGAFQPPLWPIRQEKASDGQFKGDKIGSAAKAKPLV